MKKQPCYKIFLLVLLIFLPPLLTSFTIFLSKINFQTISAPGHSPAPGNNMIDTNSDLSISEGKISGTGSPANVTLLCNKKSNQISLNSSAGFEISAPSPWAITFTNISVSEIFLDGTIEDFTSIPLLNRIDIKDNFYAMQFNVTRDSFLKNFSIYVYDLLKVSNLQVFIYNATMQGSYPAPHVELANETFIVDSNLDFAWINFIFSTSVSLNHSNTYANAFFLVLYATVEPGGKFQWGHDDDSSGVDYGAAYSYSAPNWTLEPIDFTLKIEFINMSRSPGSIDLRINGTSVTDKSGNSGEWISTTIYTDPNGSILFLFSANISTFFVVEWFLTYNLSFISGVNTYFIGYDSIPFIFWNATYSATFLANSFDQQLFFEIPAWKSINNVWRDQTKHLDWNSSLIGSTSRVQITNAENASWTIQCNDTNYVESVFVKRGGVPVSEVNGTDTIEIFSNFTTILTSGDANLTIFPLDAAYNDTDGELITNNITIQFTPNWRLNDTALSSYSAARLQVIWCNGTAVGINSTLLTVNQIPTNISYISHTAIAQSGESIFARVNFSDYYTGEGIKGATLLVKNSTDGTTWPAPYQIINDYLNGTYKIEILTLSIETGIHFLSINLSKVLFLSAEIFNLSITIAGGLSNITITAPSCFGLDPLNQTHAITNPIPYHNSSVKVRIFYFSDLTLEGLPNGIISATWVGGGPTISWIPSFFGYYNITIDVTGFHAGTNHTLRLTIQQIGYDPAILEIIVPIRKLPTSIESLELNFSAYLTETIVVQVLYQDVYNDISIPSVYDLNGNVTLCVGNICENMTLLYPSIGIYQYLLDLSSLSLLEGQTYNISVSAFTSEHEFAMVNISLYVIPRLAVNLTLLDEPPYFLAGLQFKVYAQLTFQNGTALSDTVLDTRIIFRTINQTFETPISLITNASGIIEITGIANPQMQTLQIVIEYIGSVSYQNATYISPEIPILTLNSSLILDQLPYEIMEGENLEVSATLYINGTLATDKIIIFTITDGSTTLYELPALTTAEGKASIQFRIPTGVTRLEILASYEGLEYINQSDSETISVNIISIFTLIQRYSPIWGTALAAIFIAVIYYEFRYRRPKNRAEMKNLSKIALKFEDTRNMIYIMFILKQSGVPLVEYAVSSHELNPVLIGGFLNAISSFKEGIIKTKEPISTVGWELDYQNFKIYWIGGDLTYFALLSEKKLSENSRETTKKLLDEFETKYHKELTHFLGNVKIFQPATDDMIRKYLETDLTLPHKVTLTKLSKQEGLNKTESALVGLALSIEEESGYFYLEKLLKTAASARGESELTLMGVIYDLWKRDFFQSVSKKEIQAAKVKTEAIKIRDTELKSKMDRVEPKSNND